MPGLIQKSGYIKNGSGAGNYARYIATRDGVELLADSADHQKSDMYMRYIAKRPRSHGLFSATEKTDLKNHLRRSEAH